jgi:hypothetical protein
MAAVVRVKGLTFEIDGDTIRFVGPESRRVAQAEAIRYYESAMPSLKLHKPLEFFHFSANNHFAEVFAAYYRGEVVALESLENPPQFGPSLLV